MYVPIHTMDIVVMNKFDVATFVMNALNLISDTDYDDVEFEIEFESLIDLAQRAGVSRISADSFDVWFIEPACECPAYDTNRLTKGQMWYVPQKVFVAENNVFASDWMANRIYRLSYIERGSLR